MSAETYPATWNAWCADCAWGETHQYEEDADKAAEQHDREQHS